MEEKVFQSIYQKFYKKLYLYALSLCKNPQDAEDLVQSTFLKAFLNYQEGGSLSFWLTRVLQNEYFDLYRKRKRLAADGEYWLQKKAGQEDMLEKLIQDEQKRFTFQAIMELKSIQKAILLGNIYFGLSDGELAQQLHISRENVRQIRSRAKKKIVERMEEYYGRK